MPIYEYRSADGKTLEVFYKMNDVRPEVITQDGIDYHRIFSTVMGVVDLKRPKTLGAYAEKNTQDMIKRGKLQPPKPKKNPWWRPNKSKPDLSLAKMSDKQKEKYIKTGEK